MAGASELPVETISFAERAIEICRGETLTDWILQPAFYPHNCMKQLESLF